MRILCGLAGYISASYMSFLASLGLWAHGRTVTLSFEDAVTTPKFIGVFRRRRKVATSFRRT